MRVGCHICVYMSGCFNEDNVHTPKVVLRRNSQQKDVAFKNFS